MHGQRKTHQHGRCGAVTVEFALVSAILFTFVLASIEFGRANVIRHTAANAAYEAARRGTLPNATAAKVDQIARDVMRSVGANSIAVQVHPPVLTNATPQLTVIVTVPLASNGWTFARFFAGREVVARCTMRREEF